MPDVLRYIVRPDACGAEHPRSVHGQQQAQPALDHGRRQRSGRIARHTTRQTSIVRASAVRARRVVVRVTHGTWPAWPASLIPIRLCIPLIVPTWRVTLGARWAVQLKRSLATGRTTSEQCKQCTAQAVAPLLNDCCQIAEVTGSGRPGDPLVPVDTYQVE